MSWLRSLSDLWQRQLKAAEKTKRKQFGEQADRVWGFLGKSYQQLHMAGDEDGEPRAFHDAAGPRHKVRRNLAQEYVALMLPYIFAQVPHRLASPRRPDLPPELMQLFNPMAIQKAGLPLPMAERLGAYMLTWYLNWTPSQYKLAGEVRRGLPEALVKGRQVVWHALYEDGNGVMPVTQHDTVESLVVDPDTESMREAAWIARKRRASAWRLEEIYGVPAKVMRAKYASHMAQAVWGQAEREAGRATEPDESTGDIVEYYEIYSRIGLGMQLPNAGDELLAQRDLLSDIQYAFLVIVPGMEYPLNLAPEKLAVETVNEEIRARLEWPLPLYENYDPWPCTILDFFPNSENAWSVSPLKGSLPLLVFLDHAWSFLLGRVRATSRDILLVAAALEQEVWDAIESGVDQETVSVSMETLEDITKLIHVIQFPELKQEFFRVIELAESRFERASGMSPLMHGESSVQYRSAREAEIKEGHVTSRPEDMADCVEAFMSDIAAKEAILTRMYVPPPFQLFGEPMPEGGQPDMSTPLSFFWSTIVNQPDPVLAASEYDYAVEAGTARRKNRNQQFAEVQAISQVLFAPLLQVYQASGDPTQVNNLIHMIGEPMGISTNGLMLPALQMQPALPPPGEEAPEEAPEEEAQEAEVVQ